MIALVGTGDVTSIVKEDQIHNMFVLMSLWLLVTMIYNIVYIYIIDLKFEKLLISDYLKKGVFCGVHTSPMRNAV